MTSNANECTDVVVRVNPSTFKKRLNITGEIWLQLDDFSFPSQSWSDFPVIILGWWLDALTLFGARRNAEFLFMDGPHLFEVSDNNGNCLLLCLQHTADEKHCVHEALINVAELRSQVLTASHLVVRECRQHGWITKDTAALESKLNTLVSQSA